MSFSFGSKKSKQKSQTDPWDVAVPYISDFLGTIPTGQTAGPTASQNAAFDDLKGIANAGNPNAGQMMDLANDQFGTQSNAPMVQQGYDDLQRRLGGVADGQNLSLENNPYIQQMLTQASDDVQKRINAMYAGAGRDLSGSNQKAVAAGVTQAQLPILFDQYNREQGRTDAAARDLYGAAGSTANTMAGLDEQANRQRMAAIDTTKAALEAQGWGPTQILNLEQQMKGLPLDQLERIAGLLYPAGQLGQQSTGTVKSNSTGFGFSLSDLGKIATGMGSF